MKDSKKPPILTAFEVSSDGTITTVSPRRCYACRKNRKLHQHDLYKNNAPEQVVGETWLCKKCEKSFEDYLKKQEVKE